MLPEFHTAGARRGRAVFNRSAHTAGPGSGQRVAGTKIIPKVRKNLKNESKIPSKWRPEGSKNAFLEAWGALGLIFGGLGGPKSKNSMWIMTLGQFSAPFGGNFGDFFGPKSMQESTSFSDVPKVALGTEKVAILTLGGSKNHQFELMFRGVS